MPLCGFDLIISDVEQLFMCLLTISMFSFKKYLSLLFIFFFFFLCGAFFFFLHIELYELLVHFGNQLIKVALRANVFSHSVCFWFFFSSPIISFAVQKLLNLIGTH